VSFFFDRGHSSWLCTLSLELPSGRCSTATHCHFQSVSERLRCGHEVSLVYSPPSACFVVTPYLYMFVFLSLLVEATISHPMTMCFAIFNFTAEGASVYMHLHLVFQGVASFFFFLVVVGASTITQVQLVANRTVMSNS